MKIIFALVCCIASSLLLGADKAAGKLKEASLLGSWRAIAKDGTEVAYTFGEDGKATWSVDPKNKKQPAMLIKCKYTLKHSKPFWHLDITKFDHPKLPHLKEAKFLGIIKILDENSFRMEGKPSGPEHPAKRPVQFSEEALVFKRQPEQKLE